MKPSVLCVLAALACSACTHDGASSLGRRIGTGLVVEYGLAHSGVQPKAGLQAMSDIFQDFDRFTIMGRNLMQNNLDRVLTAYPAADEEEVAARVARLHNGGNWRAPLATLKGAGDSFNYLKRFLGDIRGEGEWRSLRCVEDFGSGVTTVAPGTAGSGVGGLEMKTLTIP